jgi:serine/threonine protein kinase
MDLGVVTSRDFAQHTTTGTFLGTIRYAAPEYLLGREYDCTADVFSFGAIAYELLMGYEFDADYQHWAELVAKRQFDFSFSWNADERAVLTERLGLNRLEFFLGILEHSLTSRERRTLNLVALERATGGRYWEKQFHFEQGTCVDGPPLFRPLGDFGDGVASLSIDDVLRELRAKLSVDQLRVLRSLLEKYYWEDWIVTNPASVEPFVTAGALKHDFVTEVQFTTFHPAVRYTFRYDML